MQALLVVGARPQFVKAAPLSTALREAGIRVSLVHTGQHYDEMSDPFFAGLSLATPDLHLAVGSLPRPRQIDQMRRGIGEAIATDRPDTVIVVGDTNSTLAGAMAAEAAGVGLVHVEAGLRSGDQDMPEEANRVLTDRMADVLFAPSELAAANLAAEGITEGVHVVGDVMRDALEDARGDHPQVVADLGLVGGDYVLATIHRPANTDDPRRLANILSGLETAGNVLAPLHPRTRSAIERAGLVIPPGVRILEPLGYAETVALIANARVVATDSGGIQKEAYWLAVPCVTLRETTEWSETVDAGWNVLVGADPERITRALSEASPGPAHPELYGPPGAAARIAAILAR